MFNNREILVDGKPVLFKEWFSKGVASVKDLLNESGQSLSFQEFISKYPCKTNFLQYYQILTSIPSHLLNKTRDAGNIPGANYIEGSTLFQL